MGDRFEGVNEDEDRTVEDDNLQEDRVVGESQPHTEEDSEEYDEDYEESEDEDSEYDSEEDSEEDSEYEPDYTFRFGDEEYEMDERLKAMITDKESEEFIRDLVERASGLDLLKEQRQHLREEVAQLQSLEEQRRNAIGQLQEFIQKNEWDPFQKTWGITDDQILERAIKIMELREMDPADRQAYQESMQARQQNYALQQQNQMLQQQFLQQSAQQRDWELQQTLQSPEFSTVAQQFDERAGRQGAFREEIIKRGQYYAQTSGVDVPPQELAKELAAYVGPIQEFATNNNSPTNPHNRVVQPRQKKTLPKIAGGGQNPVKKPIRSIAELRAKAQEFATG